MLLPLPKMEVRGQKMVEKVGTVVPSRIGTPLGCLLAF
jgi:hypothetical protein